VTGRAKEVVNEVMNGAASQSRRGKAEPILVGVLVCLGLLGLGPLATGAEPFLSSLVAVLLGFASASVSVVSALWLRWRKQRSAVVLAVGGVLTVMLLSTFGTYWPLHASFLLAHQRLEELAARVGAGKTVTLPTRAGPFQIRAAEIHESGIVCLWTDLAPSGKTGFVRTAPDHVPFNLWSHVPLDERWQYISED
jgi:hypothetical protein